MSVVCLDSGESIMEVIMGLKLVATFATSGQETCWQGKLLLLKNNHLFSAAACFGRILPFLGSSPEIVFRICTLKIA